MISSSFAQLAPAQEELEPDIFRQTNPNLNSKKVYRKIVPMVPNTNLKLNNIFRDTPYREHMKLQASEMPLGGVDLFEQAKNRYKSQTTPTLIDDEEGYDNNNNRQSKTTRRRIVAKTYNQSTQPMNNRDSKTIQQREEKVMATYRPAAEQQSVDQVYRVKDCNRMSAHSTKLRLISNIGSSKQKTTTSSQSRVFRTSSMQNQNPKIYEKGIQNYMSKVNVQSYADFSQPLEIKYGERYFEYLLRERHRDQPINKLYLQQITKERHKSNFVQSVEKNSGEMGKTLLGTLGQKEFLEVKGVSKKAKERQAWGSCYPLNFN